MLRMDPQDQDRSYSAASGRLTCVSIAASALCEPLAFRIEQRRGARGGDRVDAGAHGNAAFEHGHDHARLDGLVVAETALPGVAVALDEARTFGDFERQIRRELRSGGDALEPRLDY